MKVDKYSLEDLALFSRASMFCDDAYKEMIELGIPEKNARCVQLTMQENQGKGGYNIINLYQDCLSDPDAISAIEKWVSAFFRTAE